MAGPQPNGIFLARPEEPFEGKRLAVKDLFDTAGLTTTYGSIIYADHVPERSAEAVTRLEAAGYANVGKTNLHEFAYGITSVNPHFGTVPESAVSGTHGRRVERRLGGGDRRGARRVRARHRLRRLDPDPRGVLRDRRLQAELRARLARRCLSARAELRSRRADGGLGRRRARRCCRRWPTASSRCRSTRWTSSRSASRGSTGRILWSQARVREAAELFPRRREIDFPLAERIGPVFMREAADVHRDLFAEFADSYGDNVRTKIERCLAAHRRRVRGRAARPRRARGAGRGGARRARPRPDADARLRRAEAARRRPRDPGGHDPLTIPFNSLGWPALALPCGPAEDGLPASLQIAGRPGSDALVLAAGKLVESLLRG